MLTMLYYMKTCSNVYKANMQEQIQSIPHNAAVITAVCPTSTAAVLWTHTAACHHIMSRAIYLPGGSDGCRTHATAIKILVQQRQLYAGSNDYVIIKHRQQ